MLAAVCAAPVCASVPPEPLVGRVVAIEGGIQIRSAGGQWSAAEVDLPLAGGMAVRADADGRAELRFGADTVALAAGSEVELGQLDAAAGLHLLLHQGRIGVALSPADPTHTIDVDTPRGQVWLQTAGNYDIAAGDAKGPVRLEVFSGQARFVGSGSGTTIAAGEASALGADDPVLTKLDAAATDAFSQWWQAADAAADASAALAHVSPEMTGYAALAGAGRWQNVTGYGAVWFPTAAPSDWVPYRFGHWRWIEPWGWTWIDDRAWGFAPSHYGRWARFPADGGTRRWGWVPGEPRVADPEFMPAAVAFLGTSGVGISYPDASGPAVGWFPLAPGEVYWPRYTSDLATIRRLNRGAVADVAAIGPTTDGTPPASVIDGTYRNREFATVVPRAVFVAGKPVAPAIVQLPAERLKNAPLLAGSPDIAPAVPRAAMLTAEARHAPTTAAKKAEAVRVLARILPPHRRAIAVGWRARRPSRERLRIVRASFHRGERRHLRFAAFRRR
ncbi:MAG TPA: DUF6600 domain-containing protein [Stellaceae bacterium]|nr:DUF6600 domain-containing protein [Stellaceae bacterium]